MKIRFTVTLTPATVRAFQAEGCATGLAVAAYLRERLQDELTHVLDNRDGEDNEEDEEED